MITDFQCKGTKKLFELKTSNKFPPEIQKSAIRKLWIIDAATNINDLRIPPSNHLERLKGKKEKHYSIRINKQWRICFIWHLNNAHKVQITDYH